MSPIIFQALFYYYRAQHPNVRVTPLFPLAQAVHESANFASHVYQVTNNCMGMGAPMARHTTATNKGQGGYAHYTSPASGIEDYLMFLDDLGLHDDAALETYIKTKYAKDPAYYQKVMKMIASLQQQGAYISAEVVKGVTVASLGVAAVGVGYAIKQFLNE